MSGTYSVWHGQRRDEQNAVCYLTAINVQELGTGSEELVTNLLSDLGSPASTVPRWRVGEPFAVSYLSSDPTDDWRDTWLLTWELTLTGPAAPELPSDPVDLTIWDSSWDGSYATPTAFVIVAVGGEDVPDLPELAHGESVQCDLGHLHVLVPVGDDGPDAAAQLAERISTVCRDHGWATEWRDANEPN